jgi:hypothetical protein
LEVKIKQKKMEKLTVGRLDMNSSALKFVKYTLYIMSILLGLMAFPIGEYGLLAVGAGFFLISFLFMKLIDKDKVILAADSIQMQSFGKVKRDFPIDSINSITGFISSVNVAKIAATVAIAGQSRPVSGSISVTRVPFDAIITTKTGLGARFILISTEDAPPDSFLPPKMASNKRVIMMNWNDQAAEFLKKHYADKIS